MENDRSKLNGTSFTPYTNGTKLQEISNFPPLLQRVETPVSRICDLNNQSNEIDVFSRRSQ